MQLKPFIIAALVQSSHGQVILTSEDLYDAERLPEMNTIEGRTAKAYVEQWATEHGAACVIQTVKDKREKYGRLLATIYAGLRCLNDDLVTNGHAVKKVY